MPKVVRKTEVNASAKRIFDILDDTDSLPKWNLVVNEIEELEPGKHFAKTNVGDITSIRTETVPNEKMTVKQEGSPMTTMGYIMSPKGDVTEVTIWGEYENPDHEGMLGVAGDIFLKSLKKYAEFLEAGGNPDEFKKK